MLVNFLLLLCPRRKSKVTLYFFPVNEMTLWRGGDRVSWNENSDLRPPGWEGIDVSPGISLSLSLSEYGKTGSKDLS
jgi:hypothetical protein